MFDLRNMTLKTAAAFLDAGDDADGCVVLNPDG